MAREVKKLTVPVSPNSRRARLEEQITAINEQLVLSSMHERDLREEAEDLTAKLQAEISERKHAEEALRKSEERFRALVTASSDVLYRMAPDWSELRELHGRDFIAQSKTPDSASIGAGHGPIRVLLVRPRTSFVPEMYKSIENL